MGYLFDLHGKHFVDMYHLPFNTLYLFLLSSKMIMMKMVRKNKMRKKRRARKKRKLVKIRSI